MKAPDEVAAMVRLRDLGWGIRRIAAEFGCSHMTVRRYLTQGGWVAYRAPRRAKALDGLEAWLAERFRRHRGNADVVRQDLLAEHGIAVSLRTVERAVAPLRRELLIEGVALGALIADKAFDADWIVAAVEERGAQVLIAQRPKRKAPRVIGAEVYKWRHLIKNFFAKIKEFKAVAMRAEKTAQLPLDGRPRRSHAANQMNLHKP